MTPEQENEALKEWPERDVCRLLAIRVRRHRLEAGLSQEAFARKAEVPLRTFKRFELEGKATLETFVQILRGLGRTQYLQLLFPSEAPARGITFEDKLARLRAHAAAVQDRRGGADSV
ncbi:helix-turn-helix transcriptional regulator [Mitsuaria sp. CC2]|uniref:hypothetical protein n=1 Tax=Mitsuaria sp. CC2 TaxID=3029186 RepID=UPI003B8E211F